MRRNAQAEMVSVINRRQTAPATVIREVEGRNSEVDQKAADEQEFRHLVEACQRHDRLEQQLFARLDALIDGRDRVLTRQLGPAQVLVEQTKDLHALRQHDLSAAVALARKNGFAASRTADFRPDKEALTKIRRACYESG